MNDRAPSFAVPVLALVALAALMGVVNSVQSAFSGPVPAAAVKQQSIEATSATRAAAAAAPSRSLVTANDTSSARNGTAPSLPARASSPLPATSSLAAARPAVAQTNSLEVVHLHRFGSCRGRLDVGRDGIAFVSEQEKYADSFTLKFAEFLHALSDDTLTLKSATKTYRFKAGDAGGDSTNRLHAFADRISRARR